MIGCNREIIQQNLTSTNLFTLIYQTIRLQNYVRYIFLFHCFHQSWIYFICKEIKYLCTVVENALFKTLKFAGHVKYFKTRSGKINGVFEWGNFQQLIVLFSASLHYNHFHLNTDCRIKIKSTLIRTTDNELKFVSCMCRY